MTAAELAAQIVEAAVVRPGDALVISWPDNASRDQVDGAAAAIREVLGDDVRVLSVGGAVSVYVLRAGEVAE